MKRLYESDLAIAAGELHVVLRPINPNRLGAPPATREETIRAAVNELRDSDFTLTEHAVLERIYHRLTDGVRTRRHGACSRGVRAEEEAVTRLVLYVAAPLKPTAEQVTACYETPTYCPAAEESAARAAVRGALKANLSSAMRWLSWLRRSFPEVTFIAPWIAAVLSGEDDADHAQREAGLVDACAVVERCDGIVLVGGRVSSGMAREWKAARRCWDLTRIGAEPPADGGERPLVTWALWAEYDEIAT